MVIFIQKIGFSVVLEQLNREKTAEFGAAIMLAVVDPLLVQNIQ